MPRHATSTSFKPGHKRSPESIEKQRQTMKRQIAEGLRSVPSSRGLKRDLHGSKNPRSKPIGSTRLHQAAPGLWYRLVKVAPSGRWPYEHRVVMERRLGRKLLRSEHVHHKNEDTLDNREENLELMSHSDHSGHHSRKRHAR